MDQSCLKYCLTSEEREHFERNGYLVIPNALSPEWIDRLNIVINRVAASRKSQADEFGWLHIYDFLSLDETFLELLDWPTTFPKVWGIMGEHIQLHMSHLDVTPPVPAQLRTSPLPLASWHQDGGRLNRDIETDPRPRLFVKIGYFLTDTTERGCGNMWIVPGSHLWNRLERPEGSDAHPPNALPICQPPGTALLFDRRLWHRRSANHSSRTRNAIFYGYGYRWLRPRGNLRIEDFDHCDDPIRRQLLGASGDGYRYSSPQPEDVPLEAWVVEHTANNTLLERFSVLSAAKPRAAQSTARTLDDD